MRFTRSECPDCTKEVLMTHELTHVYAKKRDASHMTALQRPSPLPSAPSADSTSVESLVLRLFRLASAAPPPGSGREAESWQRPECVAPPVAVTVVSRSVSGQTRHDHNKRTLDMV